MGPNFKNNRLRGRPVTANAAFVNIMNGVGLFPSRALHFGTKERNKVVLLLSKLASGIHSGKWLRPAALSQVSVGNTYVRLTQLATGCDHAPHKRKQRPLSGAFPGQEFRHAHTRVQTQTMKSSPTKGKFKKSVQAWFLTSKQAGIKSTPLIFHLLQKVGLPFLLGLSWRIRNSSVIPDDTNQKESPTT